MRKKAIKDVFGVVVALVVFAGISVFNMLPPVLIAAVVAAGVVKVWLARRKEGEK